MFWILRERKYFFQLLKICKQLLHPLQQEILQGRALNTVCLHMQVMQPKGLTRIIFGLQALAPAHPFLWQTAIYTLCQQSLRGVGQLDRNEQPPLALFFLMRREFPRWPPMADPQSTLEPMKQLFSDDPSQSSIPSHTTATHGCGDTGAPEDLAANLPALLDSVLQLATLAASCCSLQDKWSQLTPVLIDLTDLLGQGRREWPRGPLLFSGLQVPSP